MIHSGNLNEKFEKITSFWDPYVLGELNGQHIKLAKFKGDFVMHSHETEDEFFYIFKGEVLIDYENECKTYSQGDYVIIPRGVRHRPSAAEEAWVMLFEPITTLNTGDQINELTKTDLKKI